MDQQRRAPVRRTLNITRGGAVSDTTGDIGGVVTVDGVGSKWTNSGGLQADGTLNISGGGTVSNTNASVGSQFGGIGTVTVKGTGWKLDQQRLPPRR